MEQRTFVHRTVRDSGSVNRDRGCSVSPVHRSKQGRSRMSAPEDWNLMMDRQIKFNMAIEQVVRAIFSLYYLQCCSGSWKASLWGNRRSHFDSNVDNATESDVTRTWLLWILYCNRQQCRSLPWQIHTRTEKQIFHQPAWNDGGLLCILQITSGKQWWYIPLGPAWLCIA